MASKQKSTATTPQQTVTRDGDVIPLTIYNGLPWIKDWEYPRDDDMVKSPTYFATKDEAYDPTKIDNNWDDDEFHDCLPPDDLELYVDQSYCIQEVQRLKVHSISTTQQHRVYPARVSANKLPDLASLGPNFAWANTPRTLQTLLNTDQNFREGTPNQPFKMHFKSRWPSANVRHVNESTMLQVFRGVTFKFMVGFPMHHKSDVPRTVEQNIVQNGCPITLSSDLAKENCSAAMKAIETKYFIQVHNHSEPYFQNQNLSERGMQDLLVCRICFVMAIILWTVPILLPNGGWL